MDPRVLNIGDTVEHSSVGPGVVTGFYNSYPMVNDKAVGNLQRTDGAKFGVGGSLALPSAVVPVVKPVAAVGGTLFGSRPAYPSKAVENPGSMPITTPESPKPMSTPTPAPQSPPAPAEAPAQTPVETPAAPSPATEVAPLSTTNDGAALVPVASKMAESQPPVPTEPAPENSDLHVRPPGSMEGTTIVPADHIESPAVEHDQPPHVSPPDPSRAEQGEPLVAPAKSPDHGDDGQESEKPAE